jgi:hypothetical protein
MGDKNKTFASLAGFARNKVLVVLVRCVLLICCTLRSCALAPLRLG